MVNADSICFTLTTQLRRFFALFQAPIWPPGTGELRWHGGTANVGVKGLNLVAGHGTGLGTVCAAGRIPANRRKQNFAGMKKLTVQAVVASRPADLTTGDLPECQTTYSAA